MDNSEEIKKDSVPVHKNWFNEREGTSIEVKGNIHARNWKTTVHEYQDSLVIEQDETFDMVPATFKGLYTIKLTPYQRTTVHSMVQLENKRWLSLQAMGQDVRLYYTMGRIKEMVGAGKTIEFIALILLQKYPVIMPEARSYDAIVRPEKYVGRTSIVKVKYNKNRILKPTLIFVGAAVLEQWVDTIHTLTDMRYFVVRDKRDFCMLIAKIDDLSINKYDTVIVKNGKISGNISWPDKIVVMDKNKVGSPYIYNALANISGYTWARLIEDDLDTIGMPYNATIIPAIFTWVASSTNNMKNMSNTHNHQFNSAEDILRCSTYGYWRVLRNQTLNGILNITSSKKYIMDNNGLTNPKFWIYLFENADDSIIGLIGTFDDESAKEIQELLNNDAFSDAAGRAGIVSHSVADIFQSLLGQKYKAYKHAEEILAFLETIPDDPKERTPMKQNPNKKDKYYSKERLLAYDTPEYNYPNLKAILKAATDEYTVIFQECGKAVDRVKDNIKHGTCPICKIDLAGKNTEVFILKCCGVVNCAGCAIDVLGIGDKTKIQRYAPLRLRNDNVRLQSTCTKCRRNISIKDLIYVGKDINKTNISEKYALTLEEIEQEELNPPPPADDVKNTESASETNSDSEANSDSDGDDKLVDADGKPIKYTKVRAIVDLCRCKQVRATCEQVTCNIDRLMEGNMEELPNPEFRKVVVFSQAISALREVMTELKKKHIKHWRLHGTAKELSSTARLFNTYRGNCVLLIHSEKLCAGLNLQPATHIVMYGFVPNLDVLAQCLGRGQRLGRESTLNIVFMSYYNEYEMMKNRIGLVTQHRTEYV